MAFVWAASEALPETREPGIGLILMRFDGRLDDGYRQKLLGEGVTVERVTVDGQRGFWVSGDAHFFFYIGKDGGVIDDGRRWVGDALAWTDGTTTYRIESALGRDATHRTRRVAGVAEPSGSRPVYPGMRRAFGSRASERTTPMRPGPSLARQTPASSRSPCSQPRARPRLQRHPRRPAPSRAPAAAVPSAAATTGPAAVSGARDAWLVVGHPGEDGVRVKLASSGEELISLPLGVPDATWGHLLTVTTQRPNSLIEDLVVQPGFGGPLRSIEGAWRLPTVGLDPMPAGVSADGSTIVLVEDIPDGASARAAAGSPSSSARCGAEPRIVELPGIFDFDTLSPDGSILYVAEHVPGPLAGRYQVRAIDTSTGVMRDAIIVDKRNVDEEMAGWPIDQEARADGVVLTLYRGTEHPFVHALQSAEAWAVCIDLPKRGMDDGASHRRLGRRLDGRRTLEPGGQRHPRDHRRHRDRTSRSGAAWTSNRPRGGGITLAKFGHIEPDRSAGGSWPRRTVRRCSPRARAGSFASTRPT